MWNELAGPIALRTGEIDLWRVDLDRDPAEIDSLFELLSDDEGDRANKYVFAGDRTHFIVGRATLRKIIGGYLGTSPEEIAFSVRHYGKPYLSGVDRDLRFNVSHSKGIAVIAVTLNREVGVDIEFVDPEFDVFSVAPSVFSPVEVSRLSSMAPHLQTAAFFVGWTRKEALLKAMGDGLSSSDELQTAISLNSEENVAIDLRENGKMTHWSITSFEVHDNFKAALVVDGKMGNIRYWKIVKG